jgi:hypothetical protein
VPGVHIDGGRRDVDVAEQDLHDPCATTAGGVKVAQHPQGLTLTVAPDHQSAIGVSPIVQIVVVEWTHLSLPLSIGHHRG